MAGWRWKLGLGVVIAAALVWILWPAAAPPDVGVDPDAGAKARTPRAAARPDDTAPPALAHGALVSAKPAAPIADDPDPGTLAGRVLDAEGAPLAGVRLALVSADGLVDEATTAEDGTYVMIDDLLVATRLAVASEERDLVPLMEGEQRVLDLVIGDVREIVGWVLDLAGEPVAGARVTLDGERSGTTSSTWSDAGGGFRFAYAPGTVVRVTADGGELGMSTVRIAQRQTATRHEVTLVLEPTATLVVYAPATIRGEVLVRAFDPHAHGADGLEDIVYDASQRTMNEIAMLDLMTEALRGFDASRPVEGLTAMATNMLRLEPRIERDLRRDAMRIDPNLAGAPIERVVRAAVDKVMREEPGMVEMMARAAAHVKAGKSGMDAMMAAVNETEAARHDAPAVDLEAAAEAVEAIDVMPLEPDGLDPVDETEPPFAEAVEPEPAIDYIGDDHVYAPPDDPETYEDDLTRLRRETGAEHVQYAGDMRAVVARGALGVEIPVRASLLYEVVVRLPDGYEVVCGNVLVAPGQLVEMQCGRAARAVLVGRVVDVQGRPVEGLVVDVPDGDAPMSARTDARGRFELAAEAQRALTVTVGVTDERGVLQPASRMSVSVVPGGRTDVGTITVRRAEEQPDMSGERPFGGVGAALERTPNGVVLSNIGDESPLGLEGVEAGATLIAVDDIDAMTLPLEDAIVLLRGDVGTEVALRLRSIEGELYDVLVQRGLIDPRATPHYPSDDEPLDYETPPLE